ncbi:MAG: hypothetical protein ACI857_001193 [Arenicella sp.]|jgi:hypothetical protein
MNRILTKKFKNLVLLLIGLFILFFAFRLGYGYTLDVGEAYQETPYFDYFESGKQNYASDKFDKNTTTSNDKMDFEYQSPDLSIDPGSVDQKYEKIAEVKAATASFDSDEEYVRTQVEDFNGIIQYEKKFGNEGERSLQLQVGVPPDNFDSLYLKLITVGVTHFKQIIKNDKTNEYLELNARKASLEKTHASLIEFKEKGGQINEFVNLENRILEIEVELQNLGVNLGDFDESNEFCTMKFALAETKTVAATTVSFYHRCKVALEWTFGSYLKFVSSVFFVFLLAYVFILIAEKRPIKRGIDFVKKISKPEEK